MFINAQQKKSILHLRGDGFSYSKISVMLYISENTVKSFCRRNLLRSGTVTGPEKQGCHFCPLAGLVDDVLRESFAQGQNAGNSAVGVGVQLPFAQDGVEEFKGVLADFGNLQFLP
jgi:hypothetical protein